MSTLFSFMVDEKNEGFTIRKLLESFQPAKKMVNHLLNKKVMINGEYVKEEDICHKGDIVHVDFIGMLPKSPKLSSSPKIDILYEDDHLLIVDKPEGLLVYDDGQASDDLTGRVNLYYHQKGYDLPVLPAHRIDVDTSGMILYAKHPLALSYLSQLFERKEIEKVYTCLIRASIYPKKGTIKDKIMQDRHSPKMMLSQTGLDALTTYESLGVEGPYERLSLKIETGRKHQIRVHLMGIGYPIVGDTLYRGEHANRLMLHFNEVRFRHPLSKEIMHITSKVPF